VALQATSRSQVRAVRATALQLSGTDEGAPRIRGGDPDGFYGAHFGDIDGNKLCVFRLGPDA
jgi:predicted lactoylglutathione lyase